MMTIEATIDSKAVLQYNTLNSKKQLNPNCILKFTEAKKRHETLK